MDIVIEPHHRIGKVYWVMCILEHVKEKKYPTIFEKKEATTKHKNLI